MDDEIDAALTEWGRRWRADQPPQGYARLDNARPDRARTMWAPSALIAVVVFVVGWYAFSQTAPNTAAGWLRDQSEVVGSGFLIEDDAGEVDLCIGGFGRQDSSPRCSVVKVRVQGVRWESVPNAVQENGRWYTEHVKVRGSWTGSAVAATTILADPEAGYKPPSNPCSSDEGAGTGLGTLEEETALGSLGSEVLGNPDRYAYLWRAASTDGLGRVVVAVVGNPSAVETKLRGLYPFPLCIVAAEFSQTDLSVALEAVGASTPDWLADVDYPQNRVIVSVAVLTEVIESRLAPFADRVFIQQLLLPA